MEALAAAGRAFALHEPRPMERHWIEAVHDPAYVEEVLSSTVPSSKERRIGFPVTARVARRSLLTSGGTWLAARLALSDGHSANSAGGSHNAQAAPGAADSVLNELVTPETGSTSCEERGVHVV